MAKCEARMCTKENGTPKQCERKFVELLSTMVGVTLDASWRSAFFFEHGQAYKEFKVENGADAWREGREPNVKESRWQQQTGAHERSQCQAEKTGDNEQTNA